MGSCCWCWLLLEVCCDNRRSPQGSIFYRRENSILGGFYNKKKAKTSLKYKKVTCKKKNISAKTALKRLFPVRKQRSMCPCVTRVSPECGTLVGPPTRQMTAYSWLAVNRNSCGKWNNYLLNWTSHLQSQLEGFLCFLVTGGCECFRESEIYHLFFNPWKWLKL